MAEVLTLKQPRRHLPVPSEMLLVCETFGLPMPTPGAPVGYTLRRRREGTEIGLVCDGHWWNLSYLTGHYPANFAVARKWIAVYADQRGQEIREMIYCRRTHRRALKESGKR